MAVSAGQYREQRHRRFGTTNPQRMDVPFWQMMVRSNDIAYRARTRYGDVSCRAGPGVDPVWCFKRFGRTKTTLPDGRTIFVGGEHEDLYDADFCIYNDVVVRHPDRRVEIYGYPPADFPPTDFQTATLVNQALILIGSLGCADAREPRTTPVYALDLATYRISPIPTTGDVPGWISTHHARCDEPGTINVTGGQIVTEKNGKRRLTRNADDFELDLPSATWRRTTDRRWRQFAIRHHGQRPFNVGGVQQLVGYVPERFRTSCTIGPDPTTIEFFIGKVRVRITDERRDLAIVIQGIVAPAVQTETVEHVRQALAIATQLTCEAEEA